MNANELRIGNYFKWISTQEIDTVEEIVTYDKSTYDINSVSISDCEPVPLNEEWLLKFGFKKVNDNFITIESYHYENKNCWIYFIADGFELELNTLSERNNLCRTYKYVHQLQNLYFAITGEELTNKTE